MANDHIDPKAADPDPVRAQVRAQEAARMRTRIREEVRAEAWAQMRARFRFVIAGLALVSVVVGGLIGYYGFPGSPGRGGLDQMSAMGGGEPVLSTEAAAATAPAVTRTPWGLRVYVSGAVAEPQVVDLPPGSLIIDALDAAGGATADANLEALNLAAPVSDNQQVQVPRKAAPRSTEAPGEAVANVAAVDINTATAVELATLPYIGETRAEAIVTFRETNGPFAHTEDIMEVPGIGPTIYARLADLITVEP